MDRRQVATGLSDGNMHDHRRWPTVRCTRRLLVALRMKVAGRPHPERDIPPLLSRSHSRTVH